MKKVLLILLITGFGFWGCSENSNLTEPTNVENQRTFLKVDNAQISLLKSSEVSKVIDGDRGGIVFINLASEDEEFGAMGWLYFPRNSFDGKERIVISTNSDVAALDFEPSGLQLDKPAVLTLKFSGLNINSADDIDFQYFDEDGNLETVEYRRLIVNADAGWAIVVGAKLNHFSRYGFTK